MAKSIWTHEKPPEGTTFLPQQCRKECRLAIVASLRSQRDGDWVAYAWFISRALAFNAIMYDCLDPMAWPYARRIGAIEKAHPVPTR